MKIYKISYKFNHSGFSLTNRFRKSQKHALFSIFSHFDHEGARLRQRPRYIHFETRLNLLQFKQSFILIG